MPTLLTDEIDGSVRQWGASAFSRDISRMQSGADAADLGKLQARGLRRAESYRLPVGAPGSGLSTAVTGLGVTSTTSEEYQCSFAVLMRTGIVC